MTPCTFEYCKDDDVGTTYEVHFVYFSAIGGGINEEETSMRIGRCGLAASGRGMLNPIVAMQRQGGDRSRGHRRDTGLIQGLGARGCSRGVPQGHDTGV